MPTDIEQVTAAVVATIRTLAGQGTLSERELHAIADQVTVDWDGACCPVCEETLCDDGCPLAGIRAEKRRADLASPNRSVFEPKPGPHGPVCPVCESPVQFEPLDIDVRAGFIATVPGTWSCPNGCDPRQA